MTTMVERMAMAMAEILKPYQETYAVGELEGTTFRYIDIGEQDMREFAIAALKAMREPTESMLGAGFNHHYRLDTGLGRHKAMSDWQAMIDQAIREAEA